MKKVGDEKFKRLRSLILKSVQYPSEQLSSESDQILFGHMDHWLPFSTSYAYAWQAGIFPILHQRGPHFEYEKYFTVEGSQVRFIYSCVLKDCENGTAKSFYDYEDFFRAREKNPLFGIDRTVLVNSFRYFYLCDQFEIGFWDGLLAPSKHPAEAESIKVSFGRQFPIYFTLTNEPS